MHHLVHYPRFIRLLGPFQSFWCMRFEAKHSYFKQLQRKIKNFIDPPYTPSMRHQQWQCNQFISTGDMFLPSPILVSPFKVKCLSNNYFAGQVACFFNFDKLDMSLCVYKWISIGSNKFKVNESVLACPLSGNQRSAFGLIVNIFSHDGEFVFVCEIYRSVRFDKHFQSFIVVKREDNFHMDLSPKQLSDYSVYTLHKPCFQRTKHLYLTSKTDMLRMVL